jgi:hypothetical protein
MATFTLSSVVSPADDGIAFATVLRDGDTVLSHNIGVRTEDIDIARRIGRLANIRYMICAELSAWLIDSLREIDFNGVEQYLPDAKGNDDGETKD